MHPPKRHHKSYAVSTMRKRAAPQSGNVRNRRASDGNLSPSLSRSSSFHDNGSSLETATVDRKKAPRHASHSSFLTPTSSRHWNTARESYAGATTHYGAPLFVPDKDYHHYLAGNRKRQKQGMIDTQCCARGCAGFSLVGIMFLLFVAHLVETQPLYLKGIRVKDIAAVSNSQQTGDVSKQSYVLASVVISSARQAAVAYCFVLVVSLMVGWNLCWRIRAYQRRWQYSDIPDDDAHSASSSLLPTFSAAEEGSPYNMPTTRRRKARNTLWKRMSVGWKQSRPAKPKRK